MTTKIGIRSRILLFLIYSITIDALDLLDESGTISIKLKSKVIFPSPPRITVELILTTNTIFMNLSRVSDSIDWDPPVYLLKNNRLAKFQLEEELYQDEDTQSTIIISSRRNNNKIEISEGSIVIKNKKYIIRPAPKCLGNTKTLPYALECEDYVLRLKNDGSGRPGRHRFKRSLPSTPYGVELLMVLDYSIYSRFFNASQKTSVSEKEKDAIGQIRYYFAQSSNQIDLMYKTIEDPDLAIYVRLVGYVIAQTPEQSPWTETIRERASGRDHVLASAALPKFRHWSVQRNITSRLPTFDHAMLITDLNIYIGSGSSKQLAARGLAYTSGICTSNKVSINEDHGGFIRSKTCAHELGHSLGASHDGAGNQCSGSDMYIMSSASNTPSNVTNPYRFSQCSIQSFKAKIAELNINGNNCLMNTAKYWNNTEWEAYSNQLPGQMMTIQNQCQQIFGNESYYCGGADADSKICALKLCYGPSIKTCASTAAAATGTTCGNKKWCVHGECVANDAAPAAPDFCTHGDSAGNIFQNSDTTCGDKNIWHCYDNHYKDMCCKSCAERYNASNVGCEYGDKQGNCNMASLSFCSLKWNREQCCESCRRFNTNIPGCEWDRLTNCEIDLITPSQPWQCYTRQSDCCATCSKYKTNITGCEWGDRNPQQCTGGSITYPLFCRTMQAVENFCCLSCFKHQTGIAGCKYGDTKNNCIFPTSCENDAAACCKTCFKYTINTTTTTISTSRPNTTSATSTTTPFTTTVNISHSSTTYETSTTIKLTTSTIAVSSTTNPGTTTLQVETSTSPPLCNDYTGQIELTVNTTCSQKELWYCYNSTYRQKCCKSCANKYNAAHYGCEYGNKGPCKKATRKTCDGSQPFPNKCCETCQDWIYETDAATLSLCVAGGFIILLILVIAIMCIIRRKMAHKHKEKKHKKYSIIELKGKAVFTKTVDSKKFSQLSYN